MDFNVFASPVGFLESRLGPIAVGGELRELEKWWFATGQAVSASVDRAGTPWLRMYDRFGERLDEIMLPPAYWEMLHRGYKAGAVWRAFAENSLTGVYQIGYLTSFFDPGLYCPYIVSLSTAVPLSKYGEPSVRERFLPHLLRRDDLVWQGATWMTEAGGGSDLGSYVLTRARREGEAWKLTGEKYFASNAGADLAIVAARPDSAADGVRGLALFLVPRRRTDGSLNYLIRRLKDKTGTRSVPTGEVELHESEGYLLGEAGQGVYLILEALNLSRVGNCMGSVALAQRALAEAWHFAETRAAFGRPIAQHPLLRRQFEERAALVNECFALAWEAVLLLDECWQERPRYSDRYHLFRLVAHLAKYYTAEVAAQMAKWAMEVHGGMGVLAEYPVERLLREAMILPIWEGTPQRQILDGLEVLQRKSAHQLLGDYLTELGAKPAAVAEMTAGVRDWLALEPEEREAGGEAPFRTLAQRTAAVLNVVREGRRLSR